METETKKEQLVRRVNELFHDYTIEEYEKITHIEMIRKEKERWGRITSNDEFTKKLLNAVDRFNKNNKIL